DQTWPGVLTSVVAPIVDEEVFPADEVMADNDVVKEEPFAGPYTIKSYDKNSLVSYKAFDGYDGILPKAKSKDVNVKYYSDANNLKLDVGGGNIDMAYRTLSPTDVEDLSKNDDVKIHKGPGGELRYMVCNFA